MLTQIGQAQGIINKIHEAKEKGEASPIPVLYFDCLLPPSFRPLNHEHCVNKKWERDLNWMGEMKIFEETLN